MTRRDSLKALAAVPLIRDLKATKEAPCRIYGQGHPAVIIARPLRFFLSLGKYRVYWPDYQDGMATIARAHAECGLPVAVVTTEPEFFEPLWKHHGGRMVREVSLVAETTEGVRMDAIEGPGIWGPYPGLPGERRWNFVFKSRVRVMYCPDTDYYRLDGYPILGYGSNWQCDLKTGAIRYFHLSVHDGINAEQVRRYEPFKSA